LGKGQYIEHIIYYIAHLS